MPETYSLPAEVRNSVMAYLAQLPYREVAQLMAALGQLQPVQPAVATAAE